MPQHVPIPNRSHKRKREIVLDLSSDFNDEVPKKFSLQVMHLYWFRQYLTSVQRPALSDSSDLNEDYANILASLDDAVENVRVQYHGFPSITPHVLVATFQRERGRVSCGDACAETIPTSSKEYIYRKHQNSLSVDF